MNSIGTNLEAGVVGTVGNEGLLFGMATILVTVGEFTGMFVMVAGAG